MRNAFLNLRKLLPRLGMRYIVSDVQTEEYNHATSGELGHLRFAFCRLMIVKTMTMSSRLMVEGDLVVQPRAFSSGISVVKLRWPA